MNYFYSSINNFQIKFLFIALNLLEFVGKNMKTIIKNIKFISNSKCK